MSKASADQDSVTVYCSCGQRLFDMGKMNVGTISIKCPRCRAVMAVTMKYRKYSCQEKRLKAYTDALKRSKTE
jgi:phage FluMu protein Com